VIDDRLTLLDEGGGGGNSSSTAAMRTTTTPGGAEAALVSAAALRRLRCLLRRGGGAPHNGPSIMRRSRSTTRARPNIRVDAAQVDGGYQHTCCTHVGRTERTTYQGWANNGHRVSRMRSSSTSAYDHAKGRLGANRRVSGCVVSEIFRTWKEGNLDS